MPNGGARLRHEKCRSRGDIGRQCSLRPIEGVCRLELIDRVSRHFRQGSYADHRKGRPEQGSPGKEVRDRPNFANLISGFNG